MTIKELYNQGINMLKTANIECYKTDALCIIEKCLNITKNDLLLKKNENVSQKNIDTFMDMIYKCIKGLPVQYITENWEFMGIPLKVGTGVLIPRDDTEVLVRESIKRIKNKKSPNIIDLCSGSGAIAIALSKNLSNSPNIISVELSEEALNYLVFNINSTNVNINYIHDDIRACYQTFQNEYFDMIISNPPYIPSQDISSLSQNVKMEPKMALDGGISGLDFYNIICDKWLPKLRIEGIIGVEIGIGQADSVINIFNSYNLKEITVKNDINNIERTIIAKK